MSAQRGAPGGAHLPDASSMHDGTLAGHGAGLRRCPAPGPSPGSTPAPPFQGEAKLVLHERNLSVFVAQNPRTLVGLSVGGGESRCSRSRLPRPPQAAVNAASSKLPSESPGAARSNPSEQLSRRGRSVQETAAASSSPSLEPAETRGSSLQSLSFLLATPTVVMCCERGSDGDDAMGK